MKRERVSILIPSYNARAWIGGCIESALSQTWDNCEVMVIDDGSTDGSRAVLERYQDRVTIVFRENRGGNPTRNELLSMATGKWVQFLDADDYLKPQKIARQVESALSRPEAGVIYSPQIIEHWQGETCSSNNVWNPHAEDGDDDPWAYHLGWNLTQTGGALFRKHYLHEVGGWNEKQGCCQDNELYFRLLKSGVIFHRCPFADSVYRRFAGTTVSTEKPLRITREILRLLEEGEAYLSGKGSLTARRSRAANTLRFRLARTAWPLDRALARQIARTIRRKDPRFVPGKGDEAPFLYRLVFRVFGFTCAEVMAAIRRRF